MTDAGIIYEIEGAQTIEDEIVTYGEITRIITLPSKQLYGEAEFELEFELEVEIEESGKSNCDFKIKIR